MHVANLLMENSDEICDDGLMPVLYAEMHYVAQGVNGVLLSLVGEWLGKRE